MKPAKQAIGKMEAKTRTRQLRLRRSYNILLSGGMHSSDKMNNALNILHASSRLDDWVAFDYIRATGSLDGLPQQLEAIKSNFSTFRSKNPGEIFEQIDKFVNIRLKHPSKKEKFYRKSVYPFMIAATTGAKQKSGCVGYAKAFALMCILLDVQYDMWASETHVFVTIHEPGTTAITPSPLLNSYVLCVNRKVMNKLNKAPPNNFRGNAWKIVDSMYAKAIKLDGVNTISLTIVNELADPILCADLLKKLGVGETTIWVQQRLHDAEVQRQAQQVYKNATINYPMAALDVAKLLLEPKFLDDFLNAIDVNFRYPEVIFIGTHEEDEDFIGVFTDILNTERLSVTDAEMLWSRAKALAIQVCDEKKGNKISNAFDAMKNTSRNTSKYLGPLKRKRMV